MGPARSFIASARFEFERYKKLGDGTFAQLSDDELHYRPNESDNSIAIIVKHLSGNMLSRWTHFLKEDGEKSWRNREEEFKNALVDRYELIALWEKGWHCLFEALNSVTESNFDTLITIRGERHTIIQAVHRQLAHYAHHVGQIVFLGKMIKGSKWRSLSIPKGGSDDFNQKMFGKS